MYHNNINNERTKKIELLNKASVSKFVIRKWNIASDNSKSNYDATNESTYNKKMLKSNLRDCNIAYIF